MSDGKDWTVEDLERLQLEGLDHLVRLQSGAVSEREEAEFMAWHAQSTVHEEAFRSAVRLQQLARVAGARLAGDCAAPQNVDRANVVPFERRAGRQVSRRAAMGGALAACLAGAFFVGRSLDLIDWPGRWDADFRTRPGERRLVRLAGGATVDLNTRTSLKLRKDIGASAVELLDGEALVASGDNAGGKVILVAGNGTSMTDRGRFNARREGDKVCITCLTGGVTVAWKQDERQLSPLEEVRYDDDGLGPTTRGVDAAALTAWQSGTLIFHDMPMGKVVEEINRYRPGRVVLANSHLASVPLTGTYRVARLDDFFIQAELGLGVKVTKLPGNLVILA